MTLRELFGENSDLAVTGLSTDSRSVLPGHVFFCMEGMTSDGHRYVDEAIHRGAVCIVHRKELSPTVHPISNIQTDDVTGLLNRAASTFYGHPSRQLTMFGITGTNGKTTVANLITHLLSPSMPAGYLGTIANRYNPGMARLPHTTPDPVRLHKMLSDMLADGLQAAAIEVSSHGLVQRRTESVDFDVAVMTNLTHEHLDYHQTMERYLQAKTLLFSQLKPDAVAVLNRDDSSWPVLAKATRARVVSYGIDSPSDYRATDLVIEAGHSRFVLVHDHRRYPVETTLEGRFNIANLLAAVAAVHETGFSLDSILSPVLHFPQIDGRMERVNCGQPFHVIVDYAHTPDGFNKIFETMRDLHGDAPVTAVFSAPGQRDKSKRPLLGAAADAYCHRIILTEGDQRDEAPEAIAEDIRTGIKKTETVFVRDRYDAILRAITDARPGDVILILTKGNERFLERDGEVSDWMGDIAAARHALQITGYGDGSSEG